MNAPVPVGYLDIKHGRRYRELPHKRGKTATLLFWYDGTDLKGRNTNLWLLSWFVVELPIECRWDMARYGVVLCTKAKPKAHVVLAPFVSEMKELLRTGLVGQNNDIKSSCYQVNLLGCCCDAPCPL